MTSPDTVQPLICSPRGDHWRKASAGKNFRLLESDAISVSSEATAFALESHDPSTLNRAWPFDIAFIIGVSSERAIGMNMKEIIVLILLSWSTATNQTAGRDSAIRTYSRGM
jgi:hypothetical protein